MNRLTRILVELSLQEDLDRLGDLTSQYFVDPNHRSTGRIVAREDCVVSGLDVGRYVCEAIDNTELHFVKKREDGDAILTGETVAEIQGPTRLILQAERTVLNFMQRLSGVATATRTYAQLIAHTHAKLLDTRKTTPGWRELEKAAVVHGGGKNHRQGLYDGVLVKDNHLVANSNPSNWLRRLKELRAKWPEIWVEFEADHLEQVESFLSFPEIDVILLDNMGPDRLKKAVALRDQLSPKTKLEASGGITMDTITGIAESGVDYISVGALTHSVRSIDLGLDLEL